MKDWTEKNAKAMLVEVYTNHKNLEHKFDDFKEEQKLFCSEIKTMFNNLDKKFASKFTERVVMGCMGIIGIWVMGKLLNSITEVVKAFI